MSVEKAELRAQVMHELGVRFDELHDSSQAAAHRAEGAEAALRESSELLSQQLHAAVDKEIEAGRLDLERGAIAKQWVTRASAFLSQLATKAQQVVPTQRGHAQGVSFIVEYLKRLHDAEIKQADQLRQRNTEEEFRSIKEERLQEEAVERASQPPAAGESVAPPNGAARGRRRRKAAEQHGADA